MIEKKKRWVNKKYTNWVATLPCSNCRIEDDTIVAHHMKHIWFPHGGGGVGMKANDFLAMPMCYTCHDKVHNGDRDIIEFQPDFIFSTLDKAFRSRVLSAT